MSIHFHTLTVKEVRRETPDAVSVSFSIPDPLREIFQFIPGQNIAIRKILDGQECRRSYSLCSSPDDSDFRIAIRQIEGGAFSTFANQVLAPGDQLEVMQPSGRFFTPLDPTAHRRYVAFAAGSGITPLLSIIRTTLAREPHSHFTLVYGNRSRQFIMFREQLEAIKNRYMDRFQLLHILSREELDSPLQSGRINAEKCSIIGLKMVKYPEVHAFFLCGPEGMIDAVKNQLLTMGVDRSKIHFELFHSGTAADAEKIHRTVVDASAVATVTLRHDGVVTRFELPYAGTSILEAALQRGIDLPFACKGGMCCTCRARLKEGAVEMDKNYALEPDELKAGYILTCQSHPRTPEVSVDYDDR